MNREKFSLKLILFKLTVYRFLIVNCRMNQIKRYEQLGQKHWNRAKTKLATLTSPFAVFVKIWIDLYV